MKRELKVTKKIYEVILSDFQKSDKIENKRWFFLTRDETLEFIDDIISGFKTLNGQVRFLKDSISKYSVDTAHVNYQLLENKKVSIIFENYLLTATELDVQQTHENLDDNTFEQTKFNFQDLEQFGYVNLDKSKEELCEYLTNISVGIMYKLGTSNEISISTKEAEELTPFLLQIGFAIIVLILKNTTLAMNSIDVNNIDFDKFIKYIFDKLNLDSEEIQQQFEEEGLM